MIYIKDVLYVICPQRIGENKWPDYGEQSQISLTDLQGKKTPVWIMIFVFVLAPGLLLNSICFLSLALFITNFNVITELHSSFLVEIKKQPVFDSWYIQMFYIRETDIFYFIFLVYQLQQEAPHPRRVTCTNEVGVMKLLQWNGSQSSLSQTFTSGSNLK